MNYIIINFEIFNLINDKYLKTLNKKLLHNCLFTNINLYFLIC